MASLGMVPPADLPMIVMGSGMAMFSKPSHSSTLLRVSETGNEITALSLT